MTAAKIKQSLLEIASRVKATTTIEDVYEQLFLLADIETSEEQEIKGQVMSQTDVEKKSRKWLN